MPFAFLQNPTQPTLDLIHSQYTLRQFTRNYSVKPLHVVLQSNHVYQGS